MSGHTPDTGQPLACPTTPRGCTFTQKLRRPGISRLLTLTNTPPWSVLPTTLPGWLPRSTPAHSVHYQHPSQRDLSGISTGFPLSGLPLQPSAPNPTSFLAVSHTQPLIATSGLYNPTGDTPTSTFHLPQLPLKTQVWLPHLMQRLPLAAPPTLPLPPFAHHAEHRHLFPIRPSESHKSLP